MSRSIPRHSIKNKNSQWCCTLISSFAIERVNDLPITRCEFVVDQHTRTVHKFILFPVHLFDRLGFGQEFFQFTRLVHLRNNVVSSNEFSIDVQLRSTNRIEFGREYERAINKKVRSKEAGELKASNSTATIQCKYSCSAD